MSTIDNVNTTFTDENKRQFLLTQGELISITSCEWYIVKSKIKDFLDPPEFQISPAIPGDPENPKKS